MILIRALAMFFVFTHGLFPAHAASKPETPSWPLQDIQAPQAQALLPKTPVILVAVIDTGVDITHPALKNKVWRNLGESGVDSLGRDKSTNGVDDDKNGFIDDVNGWNFVSNNNQLEDNHGHGTHVSGIMTAIAANVEVMVLKYHDPKSSNEDPLKNTVKAIQYAIKMGAKIINYSSGGMQKSSEEEAAIRLAMKAGVLFVAAAGNEGTNSDNEGFYPANYGLSNIIAVTALDVDHKVLSTSNFGRKSVHLSAPGKNIYSTLPGGKYGYMTGTSQATAFVTGVAALIMGENPEQADPLYVSKRLTQTGQHENSLAGKTIFENHLNAYRAIATKPAGVSTFGGTAANTALTNPSYFSSELAQFPQSILTPTKRLD